MNTYHLAKNFPTHEDALQYILKLHAVLEECATYFDNHSEVNDGPDGQQVPNEAMVLLTTIEKVL